MPSAAPLILGSAFRRETPALDSFLLLESLELNAYFNVQWIYYSKYNKKNALNASIPNGETGLKCEY